MNKNNKPIKSAGGIVIRQENNTWKVALLYKNQGWFFPKGRTEGNETEEQTAIREIKEELGISPKELKIITKLGYMDYIASQKEDGYALRPKTVALFLVETKKKELKFLKEDGFQKVDWLDLKQALRIVPFPEMKDILLKTIFFLEKRRREQDAIKTIVIGVGGKGERMKLRNFPKLLLPIQGRPYLGYLLDTLLACTANFNQIYLFTHHYAKEIEQFVKSNYSQIPKIKTVFTGANSFAQQLYSAKNLLDEDFIYMDGNVICEPQLFKELSQKHLGSKSLITLAVSPQNLAPTHFQVKLDSRDKIIDSLSGLLTDINKKEEKGLWCSMGIHAISHYIFDLLPDLVYFYDLDLIADILIKSGADFPITPYIYKKEWYCLHNKQDYKMMKTEGKNFFSKVIEN